MWVEQVKVLEAAVEREPDLVLVFGPTDVLRQSELPSRLAQRFPGALHLGCSSGTVVDGATLSDETPTAYGVGFARTPLRLVTQRLDGVGSSQAVGEAIGRGLASPDLVGVFVLSAGLGVNGSALVDGLVATVGPGVAVGGGLAGDGARFMDTLVSVGGVAASDQVAALGFYGDAIRIAHGGAGGWDEFGPSRQITRSEGNVLHELDGGKALDLYERYLGEEADDLPASGLLYPLNIWDPANPQNAVVRTLLAVDREARTMTFAGDVPQGWRARLMRGAFDHLTEGAAAAASHAAAELAAQGAKAELCLFVSCVGRRLLMGQHTADEVGSVCAVLGDQTPLVGFYSYGEIAPNNRSDRCGLHNQTVTLTLLAEAA